MGCFSTLRFTLRDLKLVLRRNVVAITRPEHAKWPAVPLERPFRESSTYGCDFIAREFRS
jgi:hypothetical protein